MGFHVVAAEDGPVEHFAEAFDLVSQLDALSAVHLDEVEEVVDEVVDGVVEPLGGAVEDADALIAGFFEVAAYGQVSAFTPLYLPRLGIELAAVAFWVGAITSF